MEARETSVSEVLTHPFDSDAPLTTGDIKEWEATAGVRGSGVDAHFFSGRAIAFLRPFSARFESHKRFGTPPLSADVHVYVHDNSQRNSLGTNAYASRSSCSETRGRG